MRGHNITQIARIYLPVILSMFLWIGNINSVKAQVTVHNPSSSTVIERGETLTIQYSTNSGTGTFTIELYKGGYYEMTIASSHSNPYVYYWDIPAYMNPDDDYQIRVISSVDGSDLSEMFEIIEEPHTLNLTSPSASTFEYPGESLSIQWSSNYSGGTVKLELHENGSLDQTIASSTSNDGSYSWSIPSGLSDSDYYQVIISENGGTASDYSGNFTIEEKSITVNQPQLNDSIQEGETLNIGWTANYSSGSVRIELTQGYQLVKELDIVSVSQGSYSNYTVEEVPSVLNAATDYRIKISDYSTGTPSEYGPSFEIYGDKITVTGGDDTTVEAGQNHTVSWSQNFSGAVDLHYETSPGAWQSIETNYNPGTKSKTWTTPSGSSYIPSTRVRIRKSSDHSVQAVLQNISLSKTLSLNEPTGSTDLVGGEDLEVRWSSNYTNAQGEEVVIELYKGSSSTPEETLSASGGTDNDGALDWTVPTYISEGNNYWVKIADDSGSPTDQSSNFNLVPRKITVEKPDASVTIDQGQSLLIEWTENYDPSHVKIELLDASHQLEYEINDSEPNDDGSTNWTVDWPGISDGSYYIRVSDATTGTPEDESEVFQINEYQITVSGGGNATVEAGQSHTISWSSNLDGGDIMLHYEDTDGSWESITTVPYDQTSYDWSTPSGADYLPSTKVRLRSSVDASAQIFVNNIDLSKTLSVSEPIQYVTYFKGDDLPVHWASNYTDAPDQSVQIELYRTSTSGPEYTLSGSTANDEVFDTWTIPSGITFADDYYIEITDSNDGTVNATSGEFSIDQKSITVTHPVDSTQAFKGGQLDIFWTDNHDPNQVHIYLRKSFSVIDTIATGVLNNQTPQKYVWDVPSSIASADDYKIEVVDATNSSISHISPSFSIDDFAISVTGGANDTVVAGQPHTFYWENNLQSGNVELAYEDASSQWVPIDTVQLFVSLRTWNVPSGLSSTRIKLSSTTISGVEDYVDNITIDPSYELSFVTQGGATMSREEPFELTWDHNLKKGNLVLEYSTGGSWYPITTLPYYETSYEWIPPAGADSNIDIWISSTEVSGLSDTILNLSVEAPSGQGSTSRNISFKDYNSENNLTEVVDANGTRFEYFYGTNSAPLTQSTTTGINGSVGTYLTGISQQSSLLTTTGHYNPEGRIDTLVDISNVSQSFAYDSLGRVQQLKNDAGEVVEAYTYTFEPNFGHTDPNWIRTEAQTDSDSRITTEYIDGMGRSIQTHQQIGSDDIVSAMTYDARGRKHKTYKPYRQSNSSHTYRAGFHSEATGYYDGTVWPDGNGSPFREQRYEASPLNRPDSTIVEGGIGNGLVRTTYDVKSWNGDNYQVTSTIDESDNVTETWTDGWGRTVKTVGAAGTPDSAVTEFVYDELDNLTKVIAPNGLETTYQYDSRGQLIQKTSPDAGTVRYTYDAAGNLRFTQDANRAAAGEVMYQTYDFAARPLAEGVAAADFSTLDPDSSYGFEDIDGHLVGRSAWDAKPDTSQYPWDQFATRIDTATLENPLGQLVARAWRYDETPSEVTAPQGQYFTDFGEYATGQSPADWSYTWQGQGGGGSFTVEADGGATGGKVFRFTGSTDGSNRYLWTWNALNGEPGRGELEIIARVRSTNVESGSNKLYVGGRLGGTAYSRDGYVIRDIQATKIDALEFDAGTVSGDSNSENIGQWLDNEWHFIALRLSGDDLYYKTWEDGETEPAWSTLNGFAGLHSDGLIGVGGTADGTLEWDWVGVGLDGNSAPRQPVTTSGPGGSNPWQLTLHSYDGEGRVSDKWIYTGDNPDWDTHLAYAYNRLGEVTRRTVSVGGQTLHQHYSYNQRGLVDSVWATTDGVVDTEDPEAVYTYTATGAIDQVDYRGDKDADYGYTIRDWVASINDIGNPNGNFAAFYDYTDNGNVQKAQFHNPLNQISGHDHYHQGFSYDGLNRLTSADYGIDSLSASSYFDVAGITYDAAGNIQTLQRDDDNGSLLDDLSYHYATGTNRLDSLVDNSGVSLGWDAESVDAFVYDANGNLTSQTDKLSDVVYDHRNLPVRFALASGDTVIANYNADGQRILKELKDGAWTFYVKDGQQTLAVLEQDTLTHMNLVANATFGRIEANNGAMSLSNARRYYIKDHLGSTRAVVDDQGTVLETHDYYPVGLQMPQRNGGTNTTLEKFTGHELDSEANLNLFYAGARYLDPALGRWTTTDPLDEYASPYVYVGNNPMSFNDPTGMSSNSIQAHFEYDFENNRRYIVVDPGDTWQDIIDFANRHGVDLNLQQLLQLSGDNGEPQAGKKTSAGYAYHTGYPGQGLPWWMDPSPGKLGKLAKGVPLWKSLFYRSLRMLKGKATVKELKSLLMPGGKVVGTNKGNPKIPTVSKEKAQQIIEGLMKLGAKRIPKDYPGKWYRIPGVGEFGLRISNNPNTLKHGTPGTIDLDFPALKGVINKIHF